MEIESYQKDIRQILRSRAIKFFILISLYLLSCKSTGSVSNEISNDYILINLQLNLLAPTPDKNTVIIDEKFNNQILSYSDDLIYDKSTIEQHYLKTNFNLSENLIEMLFNKNQVFQYYNGYQHNLIVNSTMLNNENFLVVDTKSNTLIPDYIEKGLITLSKPVFTENNNYALISFYSGNYMRDIGESGFSIYKLENREWILIETIIMEIS